MFYLRTCLYFDSLLYNFKNMQISLMILYRQQIFVINSFYIYKGQKKRQFGTPKSQFGYQNVQVEKYEKFSLKVAFNFKITAQFSKLLKTVSKPRILCLVPQVIVFFCVLICFFFYFEIPRTPEKVLSFFVIL